MRIFLNSAIYENNNRKKKLPNVLDNSKLISTLFIIRLYFFFITFPTSKVEVFINLFCLTEKHSYPSSSFREALNGIGCISEKEIRECLIKGLSGLIFYANGSTGNEKE